jgi:glycosyltransferase involved in cell wall biosynthesis
MVQRPRVLLLIPHLGGGGAERVTTLLTRGLSTQKYEVHLGLITESGPLCDLIPKWVGIHSLGVRRVRSSALSLLRLVRRLEPDVILSGMAHLNFLVLLLRPFFPRKTRVVVRQNATVSGDLYSGRVPAYTRFLYRHLYPCADRIVCQTDAMAADLAVHSGVGETRLEVLPNPVDGEAIRTPGPDVPNHWPGAGPNLLAVGRLSREKGFDLLLDAFSSLRLKYPAAQLNLLGEGPEFSDLQRLRRGLHLEGSVRFAGYVSRPEAFFPGATLFVLPSRQEGLPNALLEAAMGGLGIVASPCSEGVVSLLRGKRGTWVANEVSSRGLTQALLSALDAIRPGQRFPHSWVEPFCMDSAILDFERLIDETLQERAR